MKNNDFLFALFFTVLLCFLTPKANAQYTHTFQENLAINGLTTPQGFSEFFVVNSLPPGGINWLNNIKPSSFIIGISPFYIGSTDNVLITGVNCSTGGCAGNELRGASFRSNYYN